ncbi:cyclopropane-fatty-acyl-phospholipid synthase family protein [Geomonas sp.]|uniref:cyclopropane-fatty-acyl-phospholipid synthase family protein n=1 Tax=Geomonas sp. TaxID=2651584 RepID=UPI002B487592|nr:cyclopropane-fatty-acyl-phospholipid synthase family protein [Geomonas sp.]HJV33698.1 cyclopropane-fatty-acyl-phospholipid synthase family protein [Geomonas sp.]
MESSKQNGVIPTSFFSGRARDSRKVLELDRRLLRKLIEGMGAPAIKVALWDGEDVVSNPGATTRMIIHNRISLLRLIGNPLLYFGDDYSSGNIDIEGGLVNFMEAVARAMDGTGQIRRRTSPVHNWHRETFNSLSDSRKNIHHHYDLGNDFYRLWLDKEMLYTCAYYPKPHISLEAAQIAKMELVCRKVRLSGGERVIEAGCGWGGLARYMAKRYGAKVRAFNISKEQVAYAKERARKEGIFGVEYIEDDYRNITGECDVFVSVGMLEHVGPNNYRRLGQVIDSTLSDTGFGLIHSIGQDVAEPLTEWIEKRIFPGSYPPTIREMMEIFEPYGFNVLDLENLRLHYARTLEHWLERYEANEGEIVRMFDESFARAWRLYLCGSIAAFRTGSLQLFQVVFTRHGNNNVPLTRHHMLEP